MRKFYRTNKGISHCAANSGTQFTWQLAFLILAMMGATFLSACGGSGGGSGSSAGGGDGDNAVVASLSNYVMPAELSAVPASEESTTAASFRILARTFSRAYSDAGTDYTKAITRKFVEERTLEQFDVLEDVLTAINQTKYYEQLGEPAYQAMVIQVGEGEGGKEQKSLQPWVVEADIVDTDGNVVDPADTVEGQDYNVRVRAWIEEEEGEIVKAQFIIEEEPNQNADGSYVDYGVWTLNVKFEDTEDPVGEVTDYFAATCEVGEAGESIIKLHEMFDDEGPNEDMTAEVKAVMYRGETTGYGKVSHPDWEAMWGPDGNEGLTEIPMTRAKYAYNEDYLGVQKPNHAAVYKDRNDLVEMTHQYGVFNADTGRDLMRDKQFGFPFTFENEAGRKVHGYYGAWQGRHQMWMDMEESTSIADYEDTVVTKENHSPDAEEETYTIGETFNGTLAMRTYEEASLTDIQGIPVEIWVNQDYQLFYVDGAWKHCPNVNWETYPPQCRTDWIDFATEIGFASLAVGENDNRKNVNIGGWDENDMVTPDKQFVYLLENADNGITTAGLYEAEPDQQEPWKMVAKQPLAPINTDNVRQLWVWVGGSVYVQYTGNTTPPHTGWVEKSLVGFDEERWQPEFGLPEDDLDYILPEGRELYINMNGANYVVRKETGQDENVLLELQTVAHPGNTVSGGVMADVTSYTFKEPWAEFNSTYEFDTDPTSGTYLMLVYKTIGDNDKEMDTNGDMVPKDGVGAGLKVQNDLWGIEAYDANDDPVLGDDDRPVAFNWEYAGEGEDWGKVTYLVDADDNYVLLSDPVRFNSITVSVAEGVATVVPVGTEGSKTLALQYDGWMMGLPDMYGDLSQNGWTMTDDIKNKVINLQTGTEVVDSVTGFEYVLKPLDISQFLLPFDETDDDWDESLLPDLTQADEVDMTDVPVYVEHGMGDMPTGTTVLYSEGISVEAE